MRLPRNPFRGSLKVESLESHDLFLKLFQPQSLGALGDNPWDSLQMIRSAQGGGKTSLLRVLTPECLRKVAEGTSEHLTLISEQLKRIGAITDDTPSVLGVYVPFGSTPYAAIARSKLGEQNPLHLFYALLDARIALTAIRGIQTLKDLDGDASVDRITFEWPADNPNRLHEFESARDLLSWAKSVERDIWRAIDRGKASTVAELGHARPYALEAFSHQVIRVDGAPVCNQVVVMADDVHKLDPDQRAKLLQHVITSRLQVAFWIAERMHAMQPYELLALDTASSSREYHPVMLSMWWQKASDASTAKFYNELASKRLQEVGEETPFDQLLASTLDETNERSVLDNAIADIKERLTGLIAGDQRFSDISLDQQVTSKLDYLIELRAIELYTNSVRGKSQSSFDFEGTVPNPTRTELSGLRPSAEYQICVTYKLPLYYDAQTISKIASWNVDQFLSIAAGLYDQYDTQKVRRSGEKILPRVQDKLIRELANAYWAGLPKQMPGGAQMQRFLQAFSKYALVESQGDTAKYPPGVTGIGFTSKDHDRLKYCTSTKDPHLLQLSRLLSSAVAHNVVFMRADSKQGRAGETVTVFYLNRLLCVYLNLPVGLGGWWKRKVDHFAGLLEQESNIPSNVLFE